MADLIKNRKVYFDFEITKEFEAGIQLHGFEVKSIRKKQGSLEGSYVIIRGGEAFLISAYIPPFQPANTPENYDPERVRKLLLNKDEIAELVGLEKQKGLTIVPISMYNKGRNIKVKIGIARGKKKYDKREDIKKKDTKRDIERTLKNQY